MRGALSRGLFAGVLMGWPLAHAEMTPEAREEWTRRLDQKRESLKTTMERRRFDWENLKAVQGSAAQGGLPLAIRKMGESRYQISMGSSLAFSSREISVNLEEDLGEQLRKGFNELARNFDQHTDPGKRQEIEAWHSALTHLDPSQLEALIDSTRGVPIHFGAQFETLNPSSGLRIKSVSPGSPAAALSLMKGDLIQRVEQQTFNTPSAFFAALNAYGQGSVVRLYVVRPPEKDPAIKRLTIEPTKWPQAPAVASNLALQLYEEEIRPSTAHDELSLFSTLTVDQFARDYGPRFQWGAQATTLSGGRLVATEIPVLTDPSWSGFMKPEVPLQPSKQATLEELRRRMTDLENALKGIPGTEIKIFNLPDPVFQGLQKNTLEWKILESYLLSLSDEAYQTAYNGFTRSMNRERPVGSGSSPTWLGVQLEPPPSPTLAKTPPAGALIKTVISGGPAEKAGLKPGDRILKVEGTPITAEINALVTAIRGYTVGNRVKLNVIRKGKTKPEILWVTLEAAPNP